MDKIMFCFYYINFCAFLSMSNVSIIPLGVKQLEHKADHSPPSSTKVKECADLYLHSPSTFHGMVLS